MATATEPDLNALVPITISAIVEGDLTLTQLLELATGNVLSTTVPAGESFRLMAGDCALGAAEILIMDGVRHARVIDWEDPA